MKSPYIKIFCEHGELIRTIKQGDFVGAKNAVWNRRAMNINIADIFGKVKKIVLTGVDDTIIQILTPVSEGVTVKKNRRLGQRIEISLGTLVIKWVGDRRD